MTKQLDFKTVYAIGREGVAKLSLTDESKDLSPLLDTIIKEIPAAHSDISLPLRFSLLIWPMIISWAGLVLAEYTKE